MKREKCIHFYSKLISEIGGNNNSKISLRVKENGAELFPISLSEIFDVHRLNRIRLLITRENRILIYINNNLKYELQLPYTPMVKYLSLATSNFTTVEYFFNCKNNKKPLPLSPFNLSHVNAALMFALFISLTINIITLFIIFIAWSTT